MLPYTTEHKQGALLIPNGANKAHLNYVATAYRSSYCNLLTVKELQDTLVEISLIKTHNSELQGQEELKQVVHDE